MPHANVDRLVVSFACASLSESQLRLLDDDTLDLVLGHMKRGPNLAAVAAASSTCHQLRKLLLPDLTIARRRAHDDILAKVRGDSWLEPILLGQTAAAECEEAVMELSNRNLNSKDVNVLVSMLRQPRAFPQLIELDLSRNQLCDVALSAIARSIQQPPPALRLLQALFLGSNPKIGDDGAAAFSSSSTSFSYDVVLSGRRHHMHVNALRMQLQSRRHQGSIRRALWRWWRPMAARSELAGFIEKFGGWTLHVCRVRCASVPGFVAIALWRGGVFVPVGSGRAHGLESVVA